MSQKDKAKYVDLKVNGRLFPSWVVANFSKLKLNNPKFYNENMTHIYSRISNEYKHLFIKLEKEKAYQIQACKKF